MKVTQIPLHAGSCFVLFWYTLFWLLTSTDQRTLASLQFLMSCESAYSGVEVKKIPQNVLLRTVIVHSFCGVDAIKWEVLRAKFLES